MLTDGQVAKICKSIAGVGINIALTGLAIVVAISFHH